MADLLLFPSFPSLRAAPRAELPLDPELLSDTEARSRALDIRRSWIVEAPAGSGKTGLLVQRYLKLLAFGDVYRPAQILVLTFTRKSDGELRDRVLEQLTAAAQARPLSINAKSFDHLTREFAEAVLARDRALGWRLLDSPAQLNIRTIDSFCAELAASTPLLAGGGHGQIVEDSFPLYQAAAERTLAELGGPFSALSQALQTLLLHRDANVTDFLGLLTGMLAQREQWTDLLPLNARELTDDVLDNEVRSRLERTLERIVSQGLQKAADALGPDNAAELARFAARFSRLPGYKGDPNPFQPCCCLYDDGVPTTGASLPHWTEATKLLLKTDGAWRKRHTSAHLGVELPRDEQQALVQFIGALQQREHVRPELREALYAIRFLPPANYPNEQWEVVKALCRVLSRALAELQIVFSERAHCDFAEMFLIAKSLLCPDPNRTERAPDPLSTPVGDLAHLLVDEMQDTSAGQYRLLEALTEFWDGASQTVFLVGDPKQSIYAFRQARVERFLRTVATGRFGDLPLAPLRLTANFRSQATLVDAVNQTFQSIFPPAPAPGDPTLTRSLLATKDGLPVPFAGATATRPSTTEVALHWHAFLKPRPAAREIRPEEEQARQIRTLIESFLEDWPDRQPKTGEVSRPPKIAVLARNRAHLAPILAEFHRDHGKGPLLFRAVDVEALTERPEVLDLLALTRALLHPADRVAWLAVLRSPAGGLSLADLVALTGEGSEADREATVAHLQASRMQHLSLEGQRLLSRVWPTLREAQHAIGRTSLSTQVERTWRSLGGDAALRPDQIVNSHRYLDVLRKLEAGPDLLSPRLLDRQLQKLYAEPVTDDTPVELMTIHKAKGLEWDLVLVPSIERGSGRNLHGLLKWLELDINSDEADVLLAPIQGKGAEASALSGWLTQGEVRREVAEAKRLLYVACTRAREELHLFATVETRDDGSICTPRPLDSLLSAAWPAAQTILQQQVDAHISTAGFVSLPSPTPPQTFALAAVADISPDERRLGPTGIRHPLGRRLPLEFDPQSRFRPQDHLNLPYTPSAALRHGAPFLRPEGSFAARAFGNAVHRFLPLLSVRLQEGATPERLQSEVSTWHPRLMTTLRAEGLASVLAAEQARRAMDALLATLLDPKGLWLLSPHEAARSEAALLPGDGASGSLRADRTFFAGPSPLSGPARTHLWIVDYKTSALGGRSRNSFLEEQKGKYLPQMRAYAEAAAAAGANPEAIILALYFPLLPGLLYWRASGFVTR